MHVHIKCRVENSENMYKIKLIINSKVIEIGMNTRMNVQIPYAWNFDSIALVVMIVVHYCQL